MTHRSMSRISALTLVVPTLSFLILLIPCPSNAVDVQRVAATEAARLPSPNTTLSDFGRFELAPLSMSDEIRVDNGKMKRSHELERKLQAKLIPLLNQWIETSDESNRGTLIIRPHLQKLKILSDTAKFFGGVFTGSSFVDLELILVDAISNKEVSRVLIRRSSTQDAEFTMGNANDERVIDFVVAIAYEYLVRNNESTRSAALTSSARGAEEERRGKSKQFAKLPGSMFDISGTYVSNYTGRYLKKSPDFRNGSLQVNLVQVGEKITGTFGSEGTVWGDIIDGETIRFEIYATGGYSRKGTWKIDPLNTKLIGKMTSDEAEVWNLTKIE